MIRDLAYLVSSCSTNTTPSRDLHLTVHRWHCICKVISTLDQCTQKNLSWNTGMSILYTSLVSAIMYIVLLSITSPFRDHNQFIYIFFTLIHGGSRSWLGPSLSILWSPGLLMTRRWSRRRCRRPSSSGVRDDSATRHGRRPRRCIFNTSTQTRPHHKWFSYCYSLPSSSYLLFHHLISFINLVPLTSLSPAIHSSPRAIS